jgi:hypothetical protein
MQQIQQGVQKASQQSNSLQSVQSTGQSTEQSTKPVTQEQALQPLITYKTQQLPQPVKSKSTQIQILGTIPRL